MNKYPYWVDKYREKGKSIKKVSNKYYLYKTTSVRKEGFKNPQPVNEYIGQITKEGLISKQRINFNPGIDKICLFKDVLSLDNYSKKEKEALANIPVIVNNNLYYTGNLDKSIIKLINKHYSYDKGVITNE